MSVKSILGLDGCHIAESEIMQKFHDAQAKGLPEIEFIKEDGTTIKVYIPHIPYYPGMDFNTW